MNNLSIKISSQSVRSPTLPQVSVEYNGHTFFIIDTKEIKTSVLTMNLSQELRGISIENLQKLLTVGYLTLSQIGEHYALKFNGRILGGGFLGAGVAYVGTMIIGGSMIAIGTVTAPVGGVALIAGGASAITAAPFIAAAMIPTPTP